MKSIGTIICAMLSIFNYLKGDYLAGDIFLSAGLIIAAMAEK